MPWKKLAELAYALGEPANRNTQIVNRLRIRTSGRVPHLEGQLSEQPQGLHAGELIHPLRRRRSSLGRHRRAFAIASCRPYASRNASATLSPAHCSRSTSASDRKRTTTSPFLIWHSTDSTRWSLLL